MVKNIYFGLLLASCTGMAFAANPFVMMMMVNEDAVVEMGRARAYNIAEQGRTRIACDRRRGHNGKKAGPAFREWLEGLSEPDRAFLGILDPRLQRAYEERIANKK
jgi:hypothetical protein